MPSLPQSDRYQYLATAMVLEVLENETYRLASDTAEFIAKRAYSCLVRPEVGDLVLSSTVGSDSHLLAILERTEGAFGCLDLPSSAQLNAVDLEIKSQSVRLTSREAEIKSGRLKMGGGLLGLDFTLLNFTAKQMIVVVRNLVQRCRRLRLEAGQNAVINSSRMRLSGKDAVAVSGREIDLKADGAVKVDGHKIMLG
ncbi:MAG: DUF3540 domain-containing protein [Deltaproteobacteria bacterium]|jgi:hypothetical protein|nr:DUF3540 domain-containing protein [Deltaproteobacteria bacterium]